MEVSHLGSLGSNTNKQSQDNSQSQSGSGSGDNCDHTRKSESTANGSGSGSGATGRTSSQGRSYKHVQLTEEVLSRHNADMQKMFMQRQRTGPKPHKDKGKLKPMKKLIKRPGERTCGVKRGGGAMEHEATASKQPFLAPSAAGSSSSLKPSSVDVWGQGESQTHIQSSGSAGATVGPGTTHVAASQYPSIVPGFYFPTSTSSISQVPPVSRAPAPVPLVLPSQQPTFLHPQGFVLAGVAAVPVQYIPGVMYQPVGPPLFNAPPLMLPNVVYQHTAVHTPLNQVPVPVSDGEKPSGAESDHDLFEPIPQSAKSFIAKHSTSHLRRPDSQATSVKAEPGSARGSTASASGKVISSHSHVAESIRSYVEDTTTVSPGCAPKVSLHYTPCTALATACSYPTPHHLTTSPPPLHTHWSWLQCLFFSSFTPPYLTTSSCSTHNHTLVMGPFTLHLHTTTLPCSTHQCCSLHHLGILHAVHYLDTEKKRASSQVSQYSQSTSVRAEAESIGSPEKQDKMTMEPRHENSR
ncbi:hypothetical protein E2C01_031748 [Portunus trituberculatus]|uniref:Period circadian protein n=1 Tax=Portunus trituberculatus TaxID=210409 RepID=A0A5B7EZF1_PORTR|nr:hypothetical protein [Portunus trituberculatus]